MNLAALDWYYYVIVSAQIVCALHVIKSRNDFYWLWIIFFLPLLGCAIYLLIHRHSIFSFMRMPVNVKIPMIEKLNERRIIKDFNISDTLDNRINYANVMINNGEFDKAVALLQEAQKGPLKNNITLLFTLAKAHYATGNIDETIVILEQAEQVPNNEKQKQRSLLLALCYEHKNEIAKAEEKFSAAQGGFTTEEARVRYGLFLKKIGKKDEATKVFNRVVESCQLSPWSYRREQKIWLQMAKENLQELANPTAQ